MAAKPPKPPGNFIKQLNECFSGNNNKDNSNNSNKNSIAKLLNFKNSQSEPDGGNSNNANVLEDQNINGNGNSISPTSEKVSKANCKCTNISIMHLFHEMKQEFPTIPDTIVAQCVSENCHHRENCVQQLRSELALHPIPAPAYPSKVLHPLGAQRQQSQPTKTRITTPSTPPTPLKPLRPAPLQPPTATALPSTQQQQQETNVFCDSVNNINDNNNNNRLHQCNQQRFIQQKDVDNFICRSSGNQSGECAQTARETKATPKNPTKTKISDMPTTTPKSVGGINSNNSGSNNINNYLIRETTQQIENRENLNPNESPPPIVIPQQTLSTRATTPPPTIVPRSRPTTLNLQSQQRQQRQQINIQLQKHFHQRNQQQQQKLQETKPVRKAPLPPIPPKPLQFTNAGANSPIFHHHSNSLSSYNSKHNDRLAHSQQSSFSNDSSLTSPTSSIGESEISVNVSLSSPNAAFQAAPTCATTPLKSPIRHRSVITLQPEPPYTRDFIGNSPVNVNPGQKSFTSVNLTLRQPNTNSAVPNSTIDISAGPGVNGNGGGLTYSSTSYDARLGYQKNFHITVTDKGGVFSASRIRPHSCLYPEAVVHEQDGQTSPTTGNVVINPLRYASSEQCVSQQYNSQLQQQGEQPNNVASVQTIGEESNRERMCVPRESDAFAETLERQKARRDKLATALRDNKKRLNQVEQEINVLTEPIKPGETIRLDAEIQKLRSDCEAMLNEIDIIRRCGSTLPSNSTYNRNLNSPSNRQQQPQPFPRQRPQRTAPRPATITTPPITAASTPNRQMSCDFTQNHHVPNLTLNMNRQQQQQQQQPPSYQDYQQYYHQPQSQLPHTPPQLFQPSTDEDEEEYSDSGSDVDEEGSLEMWACNMCTFQNHPQLNICEACENVRILPGTIRIVPTAAATNAAGGGAIRASSTSSATSTPINTNSSATGNPRDNDANLTPQQFALHT